MFRALAVIILLSVGASAFAGSRKGETPCVNRIRDYQFRTQHFDRISLLSSLVPKASNDKERAEIYHQMARAAWMADPVEYYALTESNLEKALELDPLHVRARELALVHAVRGVERGDDHSLQMALSHGRELLSIPSVIASSAKSAAIKATCDWLEGKHRGRLALAFMVKPNVGAEQNPTHFLRQTAHLFFDFQQALAEVDDSDPGFLEELLGESPLDALEQGVQLLGDRLSALMLLGKMDAALDEYRRIVLRLVGGMNPTTEHDGSLLVIPVLELASRFAVFRDDVRLKQWARTVRTIWGNGRAHTVDWIDLLIAGHLAPNKPKARRLWKMARGAFKSSVENHNVVVHAASDFAILHFNSLLEKDTDWN
jgi:hypothetical protein